MSENDYITHTEFAMFTDSLVNKFNEVIKVINSEFTYMHNEFTHTHKRLDDIERRLDKIEDRSKMMVTDITNIKGDVHGVKNETRLIPQMIEMFKIDGFEIVDIRTRVENLEKHSGEEKV